MMMIRSATISPDGFYRYMLTRIWDEMKPPLLACGNNPSRADAEVDDQTVTKLVGFASRWGYGRLILGNAFAFRATDPTDLRRCADPVGPENDEVLRMSALQRQPVLCCWGDLAEFQDRGEYVERLFRALGVELWCLGLTLNGNPRHPSRLGYATPKQVWIR